MTPEGLDPSAPVPAGAEIAVTAAVLFHRGAVLIAQRPAGDALAGKWEFPGGKVEDGETPEQCLVREIAEEFGIGIAVAAFWGSAVHAYPGKRIRLMAYEVAWTHGQMAATSHSAWRFVAPAQLEAVDLAPADRFIARLVIARAPRLPSCA